MFFASRMVYEILSSEILFSGIKTNDGC